MERYIYLLLTLPFLVAVAIIFIKRADLRKFIIGTGILGGLVGVISEYWYFQDYWRPPSLFGLAVPSVEDFLFGFGIVSLGATAGLFLLKQTRLPRRKATARGRIIVIVALVVIAMILLTDVAGLNSIVASYLIFLAILLIGLINRPSLWKHAAISAVVLTLLTIPNYFVLFAILDTEYLSQYFLLHGTWWAPELFGFLPLTEIVWYIVWGASAAVLYDLLNGHRDTLQASP